jgi:hypothetical protein
MSLVTDMLRGTDDNVEVEFETEVPDSPAILKEPICLK